MDDKLTEAIYEQALCHELVLRQIPFERQKEIVIDYKGRRLCGQRLDLLIDNQVVVELKSLTKLPEVAIAQVLSYLKASDLKRALLINFCSRYLVDGIKRISL
jgi:GxxExxY protein